MSEHRSWPYRLTLVLSGVIVYSCLNYSTGVSQILHFWSVGAYDQAAVWMACYILFCVSFFSVLTLLRGWWLALFVGLSSLSAMTNIIYVSIMGSRIDQDVVTWLMDQRAGLPNVYSEFLGKFILAGACVLGLAALLLSWRFSVVRTTDIRPLAAKQGLWRAGAGTAFLVIHLLAYCAQPDMLAAEINVPLLAIADCFSTEPEPGTVTVLPAARTRVDKVVLIVDESVRADYFARVLGDSLEGLPRLDYGEAAATVPCSGGSNALLRWGIDQTRVTSGNYDPRKSIYIWSYARHAGYETVLIDGQRSGSSPQNFLGRKERLLIDEEVQLSPGDPLDTDIEIARELKKRFMNNNKEFIYVVKRGVHYPYEFSYPKGYLSDQATRIEKYEAAVLYSTGRFFYEMKSGIDYSRVFVIYTSDHGQVFQEGRPTHCRPDSAWQQYSVPLVVLTGSQDIRQRLSEGIAMVRNHASHEQIFPTLLSAMGYIPDTSAPRYATPLYDRWNRYTVLQYPFVPTTGNQTKGVSFEVFDHFPYRPAEE